MEAYEKRALENFFEELPDGSIEQLSQNAKADSGKPRLSLVPASLERAVCEIREYATRTKYKDQNNWKQVEPQRYFEAMLRHTNSMREHGIYSLDEESGLPHLWHLACSISFLIEFQNMGEVKND